MFDINRDRKSKKSSMKTRKFNKNMKRKLVIVFCILAVLTTVVIVNTIRISVVDGSDYRILVLSQQDKSSTVLPYKRGDILDRNGNVLATSTKVYNLVLDPKIILSNEKYLEPTLKALTENFELSREDLVNTINEKSTSRYVVTLKALTYEQIEKFEKILEDKDENPYVKGVWFESEYLRNYPYSTLAASTIGYTNAGNAGTWGIEEYYNDTLNGVNGRKYGFVNEDNTMETIIKSPKDGNTVVSTIDMNMQKIVEDKIQLCVERYHPQNVAVVVADPTDGEILAMSSSKNVFDPNNPRDMTRYYTTEQINAMTDEEVVNNMSQICKNYCTSDTFEAGSTVKPFSVAAALEEGVVNKDQTFVCDGAQSVGGWTIHCHKRAGHGLVSLEQSIMYSCNDALMQIAALVGKNAFCDYQSKFGFGMKTGVDLPGEASAAGLLYTPDTMDDASLATNSFGQNFNVTMMQMTAGFSALINGGNYYQPHVVKQIVNADGAIVENVEKKLIRQVVTEDTSEFLRQALRDTVVAGTGTKASVAGYEVAGKTGTAQITGRRNEDVYILSFLGYAPYNDPKILCYVLVDQPDVPDKSSSSYASLLFSEIMTEILPYSGVYATDEAAAAQAAAERKAAEEAERAALAQQDAQQNAEQNAGENVEQTGEQNGDDTQDSAEDTARAQEQPEGETAPPAQPEENAGVDESYEDSAYGEIPNDANILSSE